MENLQQQDEFNSQLEQPIRNMSIEKLFSEEYSKVADDLIEQLGGCGDDSVAQTDQEMFKFYYEEIDFIYHYIMSGSVDAQQQDQDRAVYSPSASNASMYEPLTPSTFNDYAENSPDSTTTANKSDDEPILRKWFDDNIDNPYPTRKQKFHLSVQTGLTVDEVSEWFMIERANQQATRIFTSKAIEILTKWYEKNKGNPYPTDEQKEKLAVKCGTSVKKVNQWFQNRRYRDRKKRKLK